MRKTWTDNAWDDYVFWQSQDRKTLKRINALIKDIERDPDHGIGRAEPLKHADEQCWSRRIDEKNRLVYVIDHGTLVILQCRHHYDD